MRYVSWSQRVTKFPLQKIALFLGKTGVFSRCSQHRAQRRLAWRTRRGMGKAYRNGKAAVKKKRATTAKTMTPEPFSPPANQNAQLPIFRGLNDHYEKSRG
jgi:hypothetical protein